MGIHYSSSKIWKLQKDANSKQKMKSCKGNIDELNVTSDLLGKLESSHDVTLKFAGFVEERLASLQRLMAKVQGLVEGSFRLESVRQSGLDELEMIRFKDLSRFKDMEIIELRLLEQFSCKFVNKESDFLVLVERIKDKLNHYDQSLRTLEDQLDSIRMQNLNKEAELQAKIQELAARADMQKSELDHIRSSQYSNIESTDRLKDEKMNLAYQVSHLKATIEELHKSEKRIVEGHETKVKTMKAELEAAKKNMRIVEDLAGSTRSSSSRYCEILNAIKEISHSVFIKYGLVQSEWQDSHWKEELETYTEEFGDTLVEIEFLCFMVVKLTSDNNWLIDRLSDLGRSQLKPCEVPNPSKNLKANVISDLKAASTALKEFEEAREKLILQFSP